MKLLHILDSICLPGHSSKPNEDRCGWNDHCAFVIDGATGLGDSILDSAEGTDAAWLAEHARTGFEAEVTQNSEIATAVRQINTQAADAVARSTEGGEIERWNLPVASFLLVRIEHDHLIGYGFGDCVLFLTGSHGEALRHSPMPDNHEHEMTGARAAIRHSGGLKPGVSLSDSGTERERQRAIRARFNTAGGPLWTLGTEPKAALHLDKATIHDEAPAYGLLCSDGFAALADRYQRYSPAGFVQTARQHGLEALGAELRVIETKEDPNGHRYPRMKVSDDATAVLFEIT